MPTYEFRCPNGHEFEKFFKTISTAPAELPCPKCAAIGSRQLSAGAGLHFKGSGFYLTDYGKNAHRRPRSDAKSESGSGSSEGGGKGEGKPEAKSEGGKAEGGKAEGGKAEGGKAEGGKSEPKSESKRSDGVTSSDSAKPKAGPKSPSE